MNKENKINDVLVIDDERDICFLLKAIIKRFYNGVNVKTGHSVNDGLQKIREQEYDVYVFDLRLGDGTGYQLIDELRTIKKNANIIVISAYSSTDDLEKLKEYDIKNFIAKPISKHDLLTHLSNFAT